MSEEKRPDETAVMTDPPGQRTLQFEADPFIGSVFENKYKIVELLGKGGMGAVYKAHHQLMDRFVAIKLLQTQFANDKKSLERFQREAKAASRLNHPNVIAVHDCGITNDSVPFIVMDCLQGQSLSQAIKTVGQLGVARSAHIFIQACDALEHAHAQGIIHRDLKPGNIMLVRNGEDYDFVKVVDFGIAKMNETGDEQRLTVTGEIFGSPVYMSPEQCNGANLDPRADIYALGCVMYETLTGKLPFNGRSPFETMTMHLSINPPSFSEARPDLLIPEWMENIVSKAMRKDPGERFNNMAELRQAIVDGASQMSSSARLKALSSDAAKASAASKPQPAKLAVTLKDPAKARASSGSANSIIKPIIMVGVVATVLMAAAVAIVLGVVMMSKTSHAPETTTNSTTQTDARSTSDKPVTPVVNATTDDGNASATKDNTDLPSTAASDSGVKDSSNGDPSNVKLNIQADDHSAPVTIEANSPKGNKQGATVTIKQGHHSLTVRDNKVLLNQMDLWTKPSHKQHNGAEDFRDFNQSHPD